MYVDFAFNVTAVHEKTIAVSLNYMPEAFLTIAEIGDSDNFSAFSN